jgi:hypothetical protein
MVYNSFDHKERNHLYFDINFIFSRGLLRSYMSPRDKLRHSNNVPSWFDEIMCGLMLGDGNLRLNGKDALLSIQRTHSELVNKLWSSCEQFNLVMSPVKMLQRSSWKPIYYFQTLTMPYFTRIWKVWYPFVNGKSVKRLPINISELLTPLAIAHWVIGDGGFDGHGRGLGRVTLYTNNFTLQEVNILRDILKTKYGIESRLKKVNNADSLRGYAIRIPNLSVLTLRSICKPHMYSSLMYKLGL